MDDFGSISYGVNTIVLIYVDRDGRCFKANRRDGGFCLLSLLREKGQWTGNSRRTRGRSGVLD